MLEALLGTFYLALVSLQPGNYVIPVQAGPQTIYVRNNKSGNEFRWKGVYTNPVECASALGNMNDFFANIADEKSQKAVEFETSDDELKDSVEKLVIHLYMNSGVVPDLSARCDVPRMPGERSG